MKQSKYSLFSVLSSKFSVRRGFTLIELLVAISIIAVLISIGVSSYTAAQRKARDAKRKADLRDVKTALEQYYNVCGYAYPDTGGNFYVSISCILGSGETINIMPAVPTDPRNDGSTYLYYCDAGTGCTPTAFRICANLESESPAEYCVTNSQ